VANPLPYFVFSLFITKGSVPFYGPIGVVPFGTGICEVPENSCLQLYEVVFTLLMLPCSYVRTIQWAIHPLKTFIKVSKVL